jgi:hypothetical protein
MNRDTRTVGLPVGPKVRVLLVHIRLVRACPSPSALAARRGTRPAAPAANLQVELVDCHGDPGIQVAGLGGRTVMDLNWLLKRRS